MTARCPWSDFYPAQASVHRTAVSWQCPPPSASLAVPITESGAQAHSPPAARIGGERWSCAAPGRRPGPSERPRPPVFLASGIRALRASIGLRPRELRSAHQIAVLRTPIWAHSVDQSQLVLRPRYSGAQRHVGDGPKGHRSKVQGTVWHVVPSQKERSSVRVPAHSTQPVHDRPRPRPINRTLPGTSWESSHSTSVLRLRRRAHTWAQTGYASRTVTPGQFPHTRPGPSSWALWSKNETRVHSAPVHGAPAEWTAEC